MIGSPLIKSIREGVSPSFFVPSMSSIPEKVLSCVRELAPRLFKDHLIALLRSDVTVFVFTYPAMSGDLAVKTTFLIIDGPEQGRRLIEFCWVSACRLSVLAGFQKMASVRGGQELRVWMSQQTLQREVRPRATPLSGGWRRSR